MFCLDNTRRLIDVLLKYNILDSGLLGKLRQLAIMWDRNDGFNLSSLTFLVESAGYLSFVN